MEINGNQIQNGCKIWCLVWRRIKLQEYFQNDRKVGHLEKYGKNIYIYGKHLIYTMLENSFSIFFWDCDIYVSNLQLTKPLTSTCGGCFIVIIVSVFQTTSFRPSKTARSRASSSVWAPCHPLDWKVLGPGTFLVAAPTVDLGWTSMISGKTVCILGDCGISLDFLGGYPLVMTNIAMV